MPTLTEYYRTEAGECLEQIERVLAEDPPDAGELYRLLRLLRGSAHMARDERVLHAAAAFESAARVYVSGTGTWSGELTDQALDSLADLRALVAAEEPEDELDRRAGAVSARWHGESTESVAGHVAVAHGADIAEFRRYASREVSAITRALEAGLHRLMAAPLDREPLKDILRRQRALLGAARLDDIPVVAEMLRAVEDLTRVVVKLDVGVKQEWLDVYRVARDGLRQTIEPLERGDEPPSSHALSRLRHMHHELLERYGARDAASASDGAPAERTVNHETTGLSEQSDELLLTTVEAGGEAEELLLTVESAPESEESAELDTVPIDELIYDRAAALRRALELRDALARAAAHDPRAAAAVEELFDLIRLASD